MCKITTLSVFESAKYFAYGFEQAYGNRLASVMECELLSGCRNIAF